MTSLVKPVTWLFGIVFLAVGLLGFVMNPILGLFAVNPLHNIVHIASGAAAFIAASMGTSASRTYLMVFGLVYLVVTLVGLFGITAITDLLSINAADNYLHLAITAVLLLVGFGSKN
jgi:hypothetical protein